MRYRSYLRAALFAGASITAAATAPAAWAQAKRFDIPAQPAASGVAALARQADIQLVISAADASGRRTNAVRGAYRPEQALDLLLAGTGLEARSTGVQTWSVSARPRPAAGDPAAADVLSELVVTGSLIRGAAPAGAHLEVMDDSAIRQTGRPTLQSLFETLPQNFIGAASEAAVGTNQASPSTAGYSFGSSINLRGVGSDGTLTLVNGRRLAPSGTGDYVDVSIVPLSAVARVEVLADGASATYGSDALAGVVNVFLKRDFDGAETQLRAGVGKDVNEVRAAQVVGKTWDGGHILASYEYYHRSPLLSKDRAYAANSDLTALGGANYSLALGNPGNIRTPLIYAGAIPHGQDGTNLQPGDILKGQLNYQNKREYSWLLPEQFRHAAFLTVSQSIGDRLEVYLDGLYSKRKATLAGTGYSTTVTVPTTNAFRRMGGLTDPAPLVIAYNFVGDLGAPLLRSRAEAFSTTGGARYRLGKTWTLDANLAAGQTREYRTDPRLDERAASAGGALNIALASSDPATSFNALGDRAVNTPGVLAAIEGQYQSRLRSRYRGFSAKLDGDLIELPGGTVKLAVGAEGRREDFFFNGRSVYPTGGNTPGTFYVADRDVTAAFAELFVPVIGPANALPFVERFDLSLSARRDHYSDFGSTTNPKIGARWIVGSGLAFRGSWGTSFKAPRLYDIVTPRSIQYYPLAGSYGGPDGDKDGVTNLLLIGGGNPDLKSENGKAWTVGVDYKPPGRGFNASITYFKLTFDDRIGAVGNLLEPIRTPTNFLNSVYFLNPSAATVAAYEKSADVVYGQPFASAIDGILIISPSNISSVSIDGIDLTVDKTFGTPIGDVTASLNLTRYLSYRNTFVAGAKPVTLMDTIGNPADLRARGGLAWSRDAWQASVNVNYTDDYRNTGVTPSRKIAALATVDLQVGYEVQNPPFGWTQLEGLRATVSVSNLFDKDPPFAELNGIAFDSRNHSPLGRFIALDVTKRW